MKSIASGIAHPQNVPLCIAKNIEQLVAFGKVADGNKEAVSYTIYQCVILIYTMYLR